MIKHCTVKIDGKTYTIVQLTAGRSLRLLTRLGKILGGPIAAMAMQQGSKKVDMEAVMTSAVGSLFAGLDENQVEDTIKLILENTLENNVSVSQDFDTRFSGDELPHLFKVLKESLKFQYGGFTNVLTLAMAKAQAMGTAGSSVQTISSGQSGV